MDLCFLIAQDSPGNSFMSCLWFYSHKRFQTLVNDLLSFSKQNKVSATWNMFSWAKKNFEAQLWFLKWSSSSLWASTLDELLPKIDHKDEQRNEEDHRVWTRPPFCVCFLLSPVSRWTINQLAPIKLHFMEGLMMVAVNTKAFYGCRCSPWHGLYARKKIDEGRVWAPPTGSLWGPQLETILICLISVWNKLPSL